MADDALMIAGKGPMVFTRVRIAKPVRAGIDELAKGCGVSSHTWLQAAIAYAVQNGFRVRVGVFCTVDGDEPAADLVPFDGHGLNIGGR